MAEIYKSKFPGQEIDERLELIPELQEGVEAAQQAADGKYTKPASGIPMTDLSDEVREAIEEGGGQADWAQTDTTAPDYIKNKPSIPTHVVRFVQQFLSDSERIQARANIGAGTYTKPSGGIPESDLADDVVPDVSDFITNTVNNLVNYYLKSETYSRSEVQQLIAAIQGVSFVSVASLPTPSADTMGGKIYLVPSANPDEQNVKDEFITIQDGNTYAWEQIGSTAVNLSGYVTTQQLNNALAAYTTTEALTTLLAAKQDTISDLFTIRSGAAAGASAYQKPQTGIPASDLAPGVIPTVPTDVVKYSSQSLTDAEKTQARTNIGAAAAAALTALETAIAAKYTKPSSGIPETDLASGVQSALALARTSIQSLADYYSKTEVDALLAAVNSEQYVDVATLPTASADTLGKIYLVGPTNGVYDRYYTSYDGTTYSWVGVGTTEINLANYATKAELNQLSQEVNNLKGFKAVVEHNLQTLLNSMANMAFTGERPTLDWDSIRVNVITNFVNPSGVSLSDNSVAGKVLFGGNYSGVIAANSGYILSNVSVTIAGGGTITYDQITGRIVSSNVTGDITINASAEFDAEELGYVKNGLAFMLDGIIKGGNENAWTDLIGGEVFENHGATAEDDHWLFDGVDDYLGGWDEKELAFDPSACTIEVAYISTNNNAQGRTICILAQQRTATPNCIYAAQQPGGYVNGCYVAGTDHVWNSPLTAGNALLALSPGLAINNGSVMSSANVNHWTGNYQGRFIGTSTDYTKSTPAFNRGYFKGKIFAIRIYNRQLTQAEILSNQAVDNNRFNLGISL